MALAEGLGFTNPLESWLYSSSLPRMRETTEGEWLLFLSRCRAKLPAELQESSLSILKEHGDAEQMGVGPGYYKYKEVQHLPTF